MSNFLTDLGLLIFVSIISGIVTGLFLGLFSWENFRRWYYRPKLDALIIDEEGNESYETYLKINECKLLMILRNEGRSKADNVKFCGYFPEGWEIKKLEADEMTFHHINGKANKKPLIRKISKILKKGTGFGEYFEFRGSLSNYYIEPVGFVLNIPEKFRDQKVKFHVTLRSDTTDEKKIPLVFRVGDSN